METQKSSWLLFFLYLLLRNQRNTRITSIRMFLERSKATAILSPARALFFTSAMSKLELRSTSQNHDNSKIMKMDWSARLPRSSSWPENKTSQI
ncbi:hypothetical protein NC653_022829 [Populus alba x Populus x berolinensis]|uniref:Secreted protein n=1 Tax=Populus alba x Populus x berolinensis TaxID=444605 RepID=A0AAD6QA53_9ROSI|nr:hypothetical protein NC653_022816 [Populus alba x Populus x berolinensis]KAJ6984651.1 hypothetical protein NC653_022829 [Populus alba x Populus x berolinensis]